MDLPLLYAMPPRPTFFPLLRLHTSHLSHSSWSTSREPWLTLAVHAASCITTHALKLPIWTTTTRSNNPRRKPTDWQNYNLKLYGHSLNLALCVFSSPYSSPRNSLSTITTPNFITEERQGQSPGWAYGPEISHSSHTSYPSTLGLSGWGGVIL